MTEIYKYNTTESNKLVFMINNWLKEKNNNTLLQINQITMKTENAGVCTVTWDWNLLWNTHCTIHPYS